MKIDNLSLKIMSMEKELLAKQSWRIKDTDIDYFVYQIQKQNKSWYEVEILKETFRLQKDQAGNWTDLDGSSTEDIMKWGEVMDHILKNKK